MPKAQAQEGAGASASNFYGPPRARDNRYDQPQPFESPRDRPLGSSGPLTETRARPVAVAELPPKEPKRPNLSRFKGRDNVPNTHELLFLALLVYSNAPDLAELQQWASDVRRREPSYAQRGAAALPVEFQKGKSGKLPAVFGPIIAAYETPWKGPTLDQIGKAMQLWGS